ncbi:uncharacterized protein [Nothobranchius furzeri]
MAANIWIALFFISFVTSDTGVLGHTVDTLGFLSQASKGVHESDGVTLRTGAPVSWRRGASEAHRERCEELEAPWLENTEQAAEEDGATLLQIRVRPLSSGPLHGSVFPGKSLYSFIRRVYRCCQEGRNCRSVKGIQGRLRGGTGVELVFTKEMLSLSVSRVELHLQLSNPHRLDVLPIIPFMAKRNFPTRYSLTSVGDTLELRVDLLFLFHQLQEAAGSAGQGSSLVNRWQVRLFSKEDLPDEKPSFGVLQDIGGDMWGDGVVPTLPVLDLGLILGCSRAGAGIPCERGGVHLSHTPFMALYFRRS